MNLLAHALLSPPDREVLAGNLTADWVKGRARLLLPAGIRAGMELHGRIDAFTDLHPLVDSCADLLWPRWGRYSPVLVDILFDHVLSVEWAVHAEGSREAFIAEAYAALHAHQSVLPPRAQYAVNALLADNWFSTYATLDGIALSLTRLSARLGHGIELAPAVHDFARHRQTFHAVFQEFFPALRRHVESRPAAAVHLTA